MSIIKGFEKELDCLRDSKTHLWTAGLASFGGSFGLTFLDIPLFTKWVIIIIGFSASAIFFDKYFRKDDRINDIIKFLKKKGE